MKTDKTDYQPHKPTPVNTTAGSLLGHLWSSLVATIVLTIICCGIYPLIVWGIAQAIFPARANGSLVTKAGTFTTKDSEAVGSALLGQNFSLPGYFHPRPSAAGNGYDPTSSGGSNLGPLSDKLINGEPPTRRPPADTPPRHNRTTQAASSQPATTQSAETLPSTASACARSTMPPTTTSHSSSTPSAATEPDQRSRCPFQILRCPGKSG